MIGKTFAEHNAKLREVFDKLRQVNLKTEPDKCDLLKLEFNYFENVITGESVKRDPENVKAELIFHS